MVIYDAHLHIGGFAKPNPSELMERMHKAGISGGVLMSIDPDDVNFTYEERISNLFEWVKGYEENLFPAAWLHPYEENIFDKVKDCAERGVCAFKFIPNNYYVTDERPQEVFRLIEELGLPIMFHSGILYDFLDSPKYNKPIYWGSFSEFKNLRFSMGHCGHPWEDECVLLFGKFRWMKHHTECAVKGEPTIYYNNPWVKEHIVGNEAEGFRAETPALYMDTTAGAHGIYRKELLTKLYSFAPDGNNIFFGSDQLVDEYPFEWVANHLKFEKEILDSAGASEEFRRKMYGENILEFLGKKTDFDL